jgi:hypothetical protein
VKKLAAAFLKHIGDYMLVETPLARADMCLLFGGSRADELAARAAELYHQGYFPLIICSGGVLTPKGEVEAYQMRDVLLAKGVPDGAILVEDKATNTGENVLYTKQLLKDLGRLKDIHSVLGIGQIHGSRRFLMTLERHWAGVTKMFTAPNYFPVSREDWHQDKTFRAAVLREYRKIPKYKARDIIREVDMEALKVKIGSRPPPVPPAPPAPG